MLDPQIEKLLIVQDRDTTLQKIEQELTRIPTERAKIEAAISAEEANIEAARRSLQAKEIERKDLDNEVKSKESSLARFRTQQLEVKKNDEYKALSHQIEQTETEIGSLEEHEIELMLEIDVLKDSFAEAKARIELRIVEQRKEISLLSEKEVNLKQSVITAKEALVVAREPVDGDYLGHYDRVSNMVKRAPYVVSLSGQKCDGCHLRVSNEVAKGARDSGEPHFCDQCARMVYA